MSAPEAPGLNSLRLEVDRTREQLESTLEEIESRLNPRRAVEFAKRQWDERPLAVIAAGVGVVGAVALLVVRSVTRG
ncbi:MAG: hypothetical protein JWP85_307 [Rhodoglobus sp.]|nr:hypothetical protein [Rhodoglobus sp.]